MQWAIISPSVKKENIGNMRINSDETTFGTKRCKI